jgi:tRNA-intron endonuclease, archaea type
MERIKASIVGNLIYSNSKQAYVLNQKSLFGEKKQDKVNYNPLEVFYLVENKELEVFQRDKKIKKEDLLKIFQKKDKDFQTKYLVFEDLRKKGYVVKTALKFGADFRVYEKKKKEHSKWIVFVQKESKKIDWKEFASKNRVAHSTRKNLLLAITDDEGGIIYYEINWVKP